MYINSTLFLVTTFGALISSFSQVIVKFVLSIILQESDHSRDVRGEIANIRTEMSKISMMDEFARHARLQRKLIKLQDELKSEKMAVASTKLKYKVMFGTTLSMIMGLFMLLMLYFYRSEPVLILPHYWLSPFSAIISWPSEEIGAVSALFWIAVCTTVTRLVAGMLS